MGDSRKPRHIRDIAHLYISSSQTRPEALNATMVVAGEHKCCFPGFHAANLAAAFVAKNCSVYLFERSGLLPNAGFYMALSPREYIRFGADDGGLIPGLGGVKVDCGPGGYRTAQESARRHRIEVFHIPPLSSGDAFREGLREASRGGRATTVLLILWADRASSWAVPSCVTEDLAPAAVYALGLSDTGSTARRHEADESTLIDLGDVDGWEDALADRIPQVIRSPDSALSRAYSAVSDSLLFKINQLGRKRDASRASEASEGGRSGSPDR